MDDMALSTASRSTTCGPVVAMAPVRPAHQERTVIKKLGGKKRKRHAHARTIGGRPVRVRSQAPALCLGGRTSLLTLGINRVTSGVVCCARKGKEPSPTERTQREAESKTNRERVRDRCSKKRDCSSHSTKDLLLGVPPRMLSLLRIVSRQYFPDVFNIFTLT